VGCSEGCAWVPAGVSRRCSKASSAGACLKRRLRVRQAPHRRPGRPGAAVRGRRQQRGQLARVVPLQGRGDVRLVLWRVLRRPRRGALRQAGRVPALPARACSSVASLHTAFMIPRTVQTGRRGFGGDNIGLPGPPSHNITHWPAGLENSKANACLAADGSVAAAGLRMRLLSSATAASSAAVGDGGEAALLAALPQLCSDAMVLMLLPLLPRPPLSRDPAVAPAIITPLCGGEPSAAAPTLPCRSAAAPSAAIAVNGDRLSSSREPARAAAAVGLNALRGDTCNRASVSLPVGPTAAAAGDGGWRPPNIRSPPSSAPLRSTPCCLRPATAPFAGGSPFACCAACGTSAAFALVPAAAGAQNSNDFTRLGKAQRSAPARLGGGPPLASTPPCEGGSNLGRFGSGLMSSAATSCKARLRDQQREATLSWCGDCMYSVRPLPRSARLMVRASRDEAPARHAGDGAGGTD